MQFYNPTDKKHIQKERHKARLLRKSNWWKHKLNGDTCYYCNKSFKPDEFTMDHKVPIIRGGKTSKSNVVVSCKRCNTLKGTKTPSEIIIDSIDCR